MGRVSFFSVVLLFLVAISMVSEDPTKEVALQNEHLHDGKDIVPS